MRGRSLEARRVGRRHRARRLLCRTRGLGTLGRRVLCLRCLSTLLSLLLSVLLSLLLAMDALTVDTLTLTMA